MAGGKHSLYSNTVQVVSLVNSLRDLIVLVQTQC
ncbi:hypothetical protein RERY_57770 [Rhodococcus erythropolis]|nr:hypothetical protein RERY_57770 [Rhodococcus erythropolis]